MYQGWKECPRCGIEVKNNEDYCPECGWVFYNKRCPRCGKYIPDYAKVCFDCGWYFYWEKEIGEDDEDTMNTIAMNIMKRMMNQWKIIQIC
ncbi:conserved hypothetical protein [Thermosipho africanus TCF52B]|uniref:DZANK-type domain-containing protein n=1 Tax=Thermosipho africanus (strain TCF52B) TaxID=484019 RepID=B7IGY6_THEAB|nr:zinc ribbon domain-containing protein [Thermosipho africanus]ACJ75350.1 conserved hypothetical protein [Thermosipho africanus TCF52B]